MNAPSLNTEKQSYVETNRKVHYWTNFSKYFWQENSYITPRNAGVLRNEQELFPFISALSMNIAVKKLEKYITLSISQIDFKVELGRVAGGHPVLLTALLLEAHGAAGVRCLETVWWVRGVACPTSDQVVLARFWSSKNLWKIGILATKILKKIMANKVEKNRRINGLRSPCCAGWLTAEQHWTPQSPSQEGRYHSLRISFLGN